MKRFLIGLGMMLVIASLFIAYKQGRVSMYNDMIQAAGGVPGAKLQVVLPTQKSIYHEVGICAGCHSS